MRKLGEQWVEEFDEKMHMLKAMGNTAGGEVNRPAVTANEMALEVRSALEEMYKMRGELGTVMLHSSEEHATAFVKKYGGELGTSKDGRKYIFWRGMTIYLIPFAHVQNRRA